VDPDRLSQLTDEVRSTCWTSLTNNVQAAVRVHLLHNRVEYDSQGRSVPPPHSLQLQTYLHVITVPKHRHAFTWLITSNHALSVERLRYDERYRPHVPREFRLCRFCRRAVEDECHALLGCGGHLGLVYLRQRFLVDMEAVAPDLAAARQRLSDYSFLARFLFDQRVLTLAAKFVFDVLNVFSGQEPYIPEPHVYVT